MKLSRQLFLVSLFTLSLPWAGCQYVRQMDKQLLDTQADALLDRAKSVASQLQTSPDLFTRLLPPPQQGGIRFQKLTGRPDLDGQCSDWLTDSATPAVWRRASAEVGYLAGRLGSDLYLCLEIEDATLQYHLPQYGRLVFGDYLILQTASRRYWLRTDRPGAFQAVTMSAAGEEIREYTINGFWREIPKGYRVELRVPDFVGGPSLGLEVVDGGNGTLGTLGMSDEAKPLRYSSIDDRLQSALSGISVPTKGEAIYLLTTSNTVAAVIGELAVQAAPTQPSWFTKIYDLISSQDFVGELDRADADGFFNLTLRATDEPEIIWARLGDNPVARVYVPILIGGIKVGGLVWDEPAQTLDDVNINALSQLLRYGAMAFAFTSLGMMAYAIWLAARIRGLSRITSQLMRDKKSSQPVHDIYTASRVQDELGDLSRQYAEMLQRVRGYTDYLQTLSSKLSHEIRTPLAIVQSSLDNLEHTDDDSTRQTYLNRAREGTERLSHILSAMSQATAVENAIEHTDRHPFCPASVLKDLVTAYTDIYPDTRIALRIAVEAESKVVIGSADLFAQMLDKLVDNAADFCTGEIRIDLSLDRHSILLCVANDGPLLPEAMADNLFDSLVSVRTEKSEKHHLGFGLYVVKRIVDFHSGEIRARNLPDLNGVEFVIRLPG